MMNDEQISHKVEPVRYILPRLLLGVLTLLVCGLAMFESASLNYKMVRSGGEFAEVAVVALAVLSILALADTVVNDMLPDRWRLQWAIDHRHLLWGCMGVTYAGYTFVLAKLSMGPWLAAVFLVYACGCMAVAFLDLRHRTKNTHEGAS